MKFTVDISIFVADTLSWGHAWGYIEFPVVPVIGAKIALSGAGEPRISLPLKFSIGLEVESITFIPNGKGDTTIFIVLEDFILDTIEQAEAFGEYLEQYLNLFVIKHNC